MRKVIIAMVLAGLLGLATAVPAFAHPGDSNNGCHFGRAIETTPPFDGRVWGENNSEFAKSEPGARGDAIGKREVCRSE